ncbi:MAG TPA: NifU family protein [Candidatus Azoamicus sp. OHIO2]
MNTNNIIITNNALVYLSDNLDKEKDKNLIVYVSVIYPLTKYAHVNITFCKEDDISSYDFKLDGIVSVYIDHNSSIFLKDAIIDFRNGKLLINAPNIYKNNSSENADIKTNIKQLFENEINVILSQHGGFIELVDVLNEKTIVIKFHGGCQGCGMVGYTLNSYIEKMIKKHFPQIENINDITAHEIKDQAYY